MESAWRWDFLGVAAEESRDLAGVFEQHTFGVAGSGLAAVENSSDVVAGTSTSNAYPLDLVG